MHMHITWQVQNYVLKLVGCYRFMYALVTDQVPEIGYFVTRSDEKMDFKASNAALLWGHAVMHKPCGPFFGLLDNNKSITKFWQQKSSTCLKTKISTAHPKTKSQILGILNLITSILYSLPKARRWPFLKAYIFLFFYSTIKVILEPPGKGTWCSWIMQRNEISINLLFTLFNNDASTTISTSTAIY